MERYTTAGFAQGHVIIETNDTRSLTIDFQNENLVVRYGNEIIASVPDLITIIEQDSGEPLSTETVKYGCRVSVLLLPAPQAMTMPEALKYVGPRVFGYDHQYDSHSFPSSPIESVWDVFYNKLST